MTKSSTCLSTSRFPRGSRRSSLAECYAHSCVQGQQGRSPVPLLQPSWGSRIRGSRRSPHRLLPISAFGGSHDYAWTANLNAAHTSVTERVSPNNGHPHPLPTAFYSGEKPAQAMWGHYTEDCICLICYDIQDGCVAAVEHLLYYMSQHSFDHCIACIRSHSRKSNRTRPVSHEIIDVSKHSGICICVCQVLASATLRPAGLAKQPLLYAWQTCCLAP